ncbi:hypothetical protein B0T11DRAFT_118550 [Plectosphaerella cucumerina]|uniref:Uncharacterized protein n=1 Tax=Plectosphaerella cucumerina TaxID=40658 RepID=A0A8K0X004_9PEZI|nr:hypothetical protein B0T11DRAFT_118550 [Plectosphaerella cucumerina]
MHPCREINGAVGQRYSLTPQLLQSEFVIGNALSCATPSNLAFYRFLLPAMQHLANNRNPSTAARPFITRLTLRDPGHSAIDFLGNSPMNPDPSLFRDLTRLDVDLDGHSFCRFRNGPEMLQSLAGARNLTHLSLQFKSETIPGTSSPSQDKNLRYEFLRDWPTFPRLEYLRVDAHEDPGGSLVAFVAKHAKTLVRLQLDIFDANEDLWTDLHTVAPDLEIYTHVDGDDEEPWATEAYRWRGDFRVPMNTSGPSIRRTHNHGVPLRPPETCDVRDPIEEAQKRESPMGSLDFDPVDPTWPGELVGLYEPLDGDLNMEQRIRTEMTEGKPMWPKDADKRIAYATEEISFLRKRGLLYGSDGVRLNPAPRWYFARDHNGQMLFRQTHPEHEIGGFPTENWLFTHHSGTQACGDDPLEYFADWEGSEAGDVQEPTPFGTQITKAGWEWPAGRGMEEEMERGTRLAQLGVEYIPMEIYREEYYPIDPSMHVAPAEGSEDGEEHEDEDDDDDYDGDSEEEDEQEAEEEWYEDSEDEEHDHHMEGQ